MNAGTEDNIVLKTEPTDTVHPIEEYDCQLQCPSALGTAESADVNGVNVKNKSVSSVMQRTENSGLDYASKAKISATMDHGTPADIQIKDELVGVELEYVDVPCQRVSNTFSVYRKTPDSMDNGTVYINIKDEHLEALDPLAEADPTPILVQHPELERVKSENVIPEIKCEIVDLENLVKERNNEDCSILSYTNCWDSASNPGHEKDETATTRAKLKPNGRIPKSIVNPQNSSEFPQLNDSIHGDINMDDTETEKINQVQIVLECHYCPKTFLRKYYLTNHMLIHMVEFPPECHICHKKFALQSLLDRHMRVHAEEKAHKCHLCRKSFSWKSTLDRHLQLHAEEKHYKCDICSKSISAKSDLDRHMLTHTREKPHKCHICPKTFTQKSEVTQHMRTHTGEKPYKCHICHRAFSQPATLNSHMLTHTGEKPHECHICRKAFSRKSHLDRHIEAHTGEIPQECLICRKSISLKLDMKRHMQTHAEEKPHKCHICHRAFARNSEVQKHMRIHTGEKPYNCNICRKAFSQRSSLRSHLLTHTGEKPHKCHICRKAFSRKSHLNRHIRTHTRKTTQVSLSQDVSTNVKR